MTASDTDGDKVNAPPRIALHLCLMRLKDMQHAHLRGCRGIQVAVRTMDQICADVTTLLQNGSALNPNRAA